MLVGVTAVAADDVSDGKQRALHDEDRGIGLRAAFSTVGGTAVLAHGDVVGGIGGGSVGGLCAVKEGEAKGKRIIGAIVIIVVDVVIILI